MEIVHVTPENSLYILPLEDGNTAVTFLDDAQVKLVTWAHDPDEEDCDIKQSIIDYAKYFTNEYRLKVNSSFVFTGFLCIVERISFFPNIACGTQ